MKFLVLLSVLTCATAFARGGADTGGANSVNYKLIESYARTTKQMPDYQDAVLRILNPLAEKAPFFSAELSRYSNNLIWYMIPAKIKVLPESKTGLHFPTNQLAYQENGEVFVDEEALLENLAREAQEIKRTKKPKTEAIKLILHEKILAYAKAMWVPEKNADQSTIDRVNASNQARTRKLTFLLHDAINMSEDEIIEVVRLNWTCNSYDASYTVSINICKTATELRQEREKEEEQSAVLAQKEAANLAIAKATVKQTLQNISDNYCSGGATYTNPIFKNSSGQDVPGVNLEKMPYYIWENILNMYPDVPVHLKAKENAVALVRRFGDDRSKKFKDIFISKEFDGLRNYISYSSCSRSGPRLFAEGQDYQGYQDCKHYVEYYFGSSDYYKSTDRDMFVLNQICKLSLTLQNAEVLK